MSNKFNDLSRLTALERSVGELDVKMDDCKTDFGLRLRQLERDNKRLQVQQGGLLVVFAMMVLALLATFHIARQAVDKAADLEVQVTTITAEVRGVGG